MSLETEFHTELEKRVIEYLSLYYMTPLINFRLPSGKVADLIVMTPTREVLIVEVKTILKHSLVSEAAKKYRPYCNRLYLAAPAAEYERFTSPEVSNYWEKDERWVGLLAVGSRSVRVIREPSYRAITQDATDYLRWKMREATDRTVTELGRNGE